jgi:hypothetical protein
MKNIVRYLLIVVIGGMLFSACEEPVNNYDLMTKDFDKNNPTFYVQLTTPTGNFETAIDENVQPKNIVRTIGVILLGAPQSSDVTITLSKNNTSTISDNAWTLASNTIVIPAGGTSGSTTLTALAAEMIEDEVVTLILDMDVAGSGQKAPMANQVNYTLKRIKFCPLLDYNDLAGTWRGNDAFGYPTHVVTSVDGDNFMLMGLNYEWIQDFWGEAIQEIVPVVVTMNPNGTLDIDRQYCFTTDWQGDAFRYEVSGTGKWDNCQKTLYIEYEIYYEGEAESLCGGYGYCCDASEDISLIQ